MAHEHANTVTWSAAAQATLHCLTGCAIGEILGMVIGTALNLPNLTTVILSIVLAFLFGYALTIRTVIKSGLTLAAAIPVALSADTISIAVMETVDNIIMINIPGAMEAQLSNPLFWLSLAAALAIAFLVTVPVNKYLISKGLGHAKMHQHHQH